MTFDLPLTDGPIGFDAGELVACPRCERQNAPDRNACLYCGERLAVTERNSDDLTLQLRKLEAWVPALNLVLLSKAMKADPEISSAARLVDVDNGVLTSMLDSALPLPVAKVETKELADRMVKKLSELGFSFAVVADTDLNLERPPIRLRKLAVETDHLVLTDFNSEKVIRIASADVCLIASARIVESRRDEVTKRKRGKTKVLDETQAGSELGLIDLYTSNDTVGFRIQANGFDFSVLEDEKGMLANENIQKFVGLLKRQCSNALIADEYDSARTLLDVVWEPEMRKDMHVRSYGKREFGTTYISSNLAQFTKYSRMRRLLI